MDSLSPRQNYFLVTVTVYFLCTTLLAKKYIAESWGVLTLCIVESELHKPQKKLPNFSLAANRMVQMPKKVNTFSFLDFDVTLEGCETSFSDLTDALF